MYTNALYAYASIKNYIKSIAQIIFKLMLRNDTDMPPSKYLLLVEEERERDV